MNNIDIINNILINFIALMAIVVIISNIITAINTTKIVAVNSDSSDNDMNQVEMAWFLPAEVTAESLGLSSVDLVTNDLTAIGGEVTGWSCQPITGQDILFIEIPMDLVDMITTANTTAIINTTPTINTTASIALTEEEEYDAYATDYLLGIMEMAEAKAHQDIVLEYRSQHKQMILERVARRHFENRATQILVEEGYPEPTVVLGRAVPVEIIPETWEEFMWSLPVEKELEGDDLSWVKTAPSNYWDEIAEEMFLTME